MVQGLVYFITVFISQIYIIQTPLKLSIQTTRKQMFITLTNASPAHAGKKITINRTHIVSVWRGDAVRAAAEDGTVTETQEVTFVFVPPHGTWEVEESHETVIDLLNA
jgi:hypothetical protein